MHWTTLGQIAGVGFLVFGEVPTVWSLSSAALITLLSPQAIAQPLDFLRHVVLAPKG